MEKRQDKEIVKLEEDFLQPGNPKVVVPNGL